MHKAPLDLEGSKRTMEANQARVHYSQGSDPDVVWRFRFPGTFNWHQSSVCWSPSGVIYVCPSGAQGPKRPATDARVESEENAQGILMDPVPYIEPAKPLSQVGYNQRVMPEVLPSRRCRNMCELRCYSACLAPYGTEQEGTSQTPLDVKPTNHNEMLRGNQILVGCGGSLQQESSSAIQFHVDSDCPWHSRQQGLPVSPFVLQSLTDLT